MLSHPLRSSLGAEKETDWLQQVKEMIFVEELSKSDVVSWAAYHTLQASLSSHESAITLLLPLFTENAHSVTMICHAINVVKSAVKHVNPKQVPVIALDQPLFAIVKQI